MVATHHRAGLTKPCVVWQMFDPQLIIGKIQEAMGMSELAAAGAEHG